MFSKLISNDFMEAEQKEGAAPFNGSWTKLGGGCIVINRQQKEKTRDKTQYGCNVLSHHVDKTGRAVHIIRRTREDENVRGKKQSIK